MKYGQNWCYNGGGVVYLLQSVAIHLNLTVRNEYSSVENQFDKAPFYNFSPKALT